MLKIPLAFLVAMVATVLAIPFLSAGGGALGPIGPHACGPIEAILATVRAVESSGNYQALSSTSTASGAYQFIDSTWRHHAAETGVDTDRFPRAYLAPPHDQDAVATTLVQQILDDHDGDTTMIPLRWYLPASVTNPDLLDVVPPGGNVLTPRQYQARWLDEHTKQLAQYTDGATGTCVDGAGGRGPTTSDGQWALPAPREFISEGALDEPHHTYPAWDLIIPTGTPIYAITVGTVVAVQTWSGNWWTDGCNRPSPPSACRTCGIGITISSDGGLRHTYCHNSRNHVGVGDAVTAGQHIADSGNTGRSGTPHLHLELRIAGRQHCPQPLLRAIYHDRPTPSPASLPTEGCWF